MAVLILTSWQTLLNTSDPDRLEELGELELPKSEDNVTSLAVGQKRGKATIVFAGVNSNPLGAKKEKNEHFRIFGIEPASTSKGKGKSPAKQSTSSKAGVKMSEISRVSLFAGTDKELYQRVTRLSSPFPNQIQLGAVTNGVEKGTEVVLFHTSATSLPISRTSFTSDKEIEDVDIIQTGSDEYMIAYCNRHDVYIRKATSKGADEPTCTYQTPFANDPERPTVPRFRSLKWLTKEFLLMLTNIHSTGGVVLQVLRLPPSGTGKCRIVESYRLPDRIKKATGIAVANLTPPTSPDELQGYTQFVIAVAGQDSSISLFKLEYQVELKISMITPITAFRTLRSVHPMALTSLAFSHFTPPSKVTMDTQPQTLKLASVSVQQTVVVHTLPLFPVPLSMQRGQSKTPRYVVALPSKAASWTITGVITVLIVILLGIFSQAVIDLMGGKTNLLDVKRYVPNSWQNIIQTPSLPTVYDNVVPVIEKVSEKASEIPSLLPDILSGLKANNEEAVVVIQDTPQVDGSVDIAVHDENAQEVAGGKPWVELTPEQKAGWKKRLIGAGHWAEEMGETVLKGVVFGELGAAIGHAVGG